MSGAAKGAYNFLTDQEGGFWGGFGEGFVSGAIGGAVTPAFAFGFSGIMGKFLSEEALRVGELIAANAFGSGVSSAAQTMIYEDWDLESLFANVVISAIGGGAVGGIGAGFGFKAMINAGKVDTNMLGTLNEAFGMTAGVPISSWLTAMLERMRDVGGL